MYNKNKNKITLKTLLMLSITILMLIISSIVILQPAQAIDENLIPIQNFILNDTASYPPHILKINDDGLFAISYLTSDRLTSIIQTINIDDDGMNYYEIDMIDFPSGGLSSTIEELGNERYLLWGNGLYTVTISNSGSIGELSENFSIYRGVGGDFHRPIVYLDDDTFLIAHQYRENTDDFPGLIEVLNIDENGDLSRISELLFEPEYGINPSPVKVDSNTIVVAYQDRNGNKISTFDISDLINIQLIQSTSVESVIGNIYTLIHISDDVYAFQTTGSSDQIQTIVINNNGIIGNIVYSSSLSSSVGTPVIIHFDNDLYVSAYKDSDYLLKLVSITDDWIFVQDDQTSFGTAGTSYSDPIYSMSPLNDEILVVLYSDTSADALSLFTYYISSPLSSTTGNVEILTTCGVQFNSGAPISYGAVLPGDTSEEQTLTLYNTGNLAGDILVQGSDWVDGTPTTQMNVDDTRYSTITGDYSNKTSLQLTDQTLLTLNPQNNTDTFWQLQANLLDSLFSGSLTQTVDFSVTC